MTTMDDLPRNLTIEDRLYQWQRECCANGARERLSDILSEYKQQVRQEMLDEQLAPSATPTKWYHSRTPDPVTGACSGPCCD